MRKLILGNQDFQKLNMLINQERSAVEFWKIVLGPPPEGKLWVVDRVENNLFHIYDTGDKLSGAALQAKDNANRAVY